MKQTDKIGQCKECGESLFIDDEIPGHEYIFECFYCGHPHSPYEIENLNPSLKVLYEMWSEFRVGISELEDIF